MSRRLTSLAAVAVTFAGALILATASPAQADADDCMSYLQRAGQRTTARDAICTTTEYQAFHYSEQVAENYCRTAMMATFLSESVAEQACIAAVEDD